MVTFSELIAAAQPPLFVVVRVRITEPVPVSALLGMYIAFNIPLLGEKVPLPFVLHIPELVVELPFKETESLFAHTVTLEPALSLGGFAYLINIVSVTALQL